MRFQGETVWLSLNQLTELFQRDKAVIFRIVSMTLCSTEKKLMFFNESRQRRKRINALQNDLSAMRARHASELQAVGEKERISLLRRMHDEVFDLKRERCNLLERSIRNRADRLGIDINSEWEQEEESLLTDRRYWQLTRHGHAQLRGLIKKAQREEWKWWIEVLAPIIGMITGLIGALAALFAILHK